MCKCNWFKKLFLGKNCCKIEDCCPKEETNEAVAPEATPETPVVEDTPEMTPETPAVEEVEKTE